MSQNIKDAIKALQAERQELLVKMEPMTKEKEALDKMIAHLEKKLPAAKEGKGK